MRRILLCIAILSVAAICMAQSAPTGVVTIANVTIIDTTGGPPQLHRTVTVRKGIIDDIRDSTLPKHKERGVEVNGTGKYLVPGLWDMHVHMVFGDWFPRGKEVTLPLFIANGITGVRDMGGELEVLQQWRKEISAGTLLGPRIVMSGPMLDGPKPRFPSSIAITTPEDGRRAVDDLKRRGLHQAAVAESARCSVRHCGRSQKAGDHLRRSRAGFRTRVGDVKCRAEKLRAPDWNF